MERIKKLIKITILLYAIGGLSVLIFTFRKDTFQILSSINIYFLFLIIIFWILSVFFDVLKLHILLKKLTNYAESLFFTLKVHLIGLFFNAITPFQTGGFPFQIHILTKRNVGIPDAMVSFMIKGLSNFLLAFILVPFAIFVFRKNIFILPIVIILFLLLIFFLLIFFLPHDFIIIKKIEEKFKMFEKLTHNFALFKSTWKSFIKMGKLMFFVFILSILSFLFHISMTPSIFYGLGVKVNPIQAMFLHTLSLVIFVAMPTPGGSGITEAGGALLFATIAPKYILGVFVIIWRFFTYYLGSILGGIIYLKENTFR